MPKKTPTKGGKGLKNLDVSKKSSKKKAVKKTPTKGKKKKKGQHGGPRPNSGRKVSASREALRQIKQRIEEHGITQVDAVSKNTGEIIKKSRIEMLLDMLFSEAMEHKNVPAAKEYMDRQLGRATQHIKGSGDNGELVVEVVGATSSYVIAPKGVK